MLVLEKLKDYAATGRTALIRREERLDYQTLDIRSDAFAEWLLKRFGDDRTPVAIYGEKETDFLCCIFGALKSGRAYVPIDRSIPADRAAQIIADVKPTVLVDFGGFASITGPEALDTNTLEQILLRKPKTEVPRGSWISGDDTAYILFTSGSTGRPKGVSITADNLDAFCQGLMPWYASHSDNVILHQISYSFDVSGCPVYAGLAGGMTLFTVDHTMEADYQELFSQLEASGLTIWVSTPSFAEICIRSKAFHQKLLPQLKQFFFCGEVLTHTLCRELAGRFPLAQIFNTYGPTEATVLVTAVEVTDAMCQDVRPIPIGKPIEGTQLRLIDNAGDEITKDGTVGELLISGKSVGPGYFGQPEYTRLSFFTDPATRLWSYRTGDLCYRWNGAYYYSGRMDNQIKLNGFRVEVEDIERNLEKLPNVVRAAVAPIGEGERVQYLAAFLLLKFPDRLSSLKRSITVKRQLAAYLPAYMIPRKIFTVESFPLNVNGKIDKKTLVRQLEEGKG